MHRVLVQTRAVRVHQVAAALECGRAHAALHALDQADVLGLQHLVDEPDRLHFLLLGRRALEEEVELLVRLLGTDGDEPPYHEVPAAGITHQGRVRPQVPDRVVGHARFGDGVGPIVPAAGPGHFPWPGGPGCGPDHAVPDAEHGRAAPQLQDGVWPFPVE